MQGFGTTSEPVVWVRELAQKGGVVCACSVGPVVEFLAGLGGPWCGVWGRGWAPHASAGAEHDTSGRGFGRRFGAGSFDTARRAGWDDHRQAEAQGGFRLPVVLAAAPLRR